MDFGGLLGEWGGFEKIVGGWGVGGGVGKILRGRGGWGG